MKTNKILSGLLMASVAMAGLTACTADEPLVKPAPSGQEQAQGEAVYMGLTIKMPSANGSRSQTTTGGNSNDGVEVGTDDENKVSSVYIVLAKSSDNSFIAASKVNAGGLSAIPSANSYKTTAKIQKTNLNDYYESTTFSRNINVFVFCNPTKGLETLLEGCSLGDTDWLNATCRVVEGEMNGDVVVPDENISIWQPGQFLMNNYKVAARQLPRNMAEWESYKTETTAFDLSGLNSGGLDTEVDNSLTNGRGPVEVERSVARFDFRDASPLGNNTYNVVTGRRTLADGSVEDYPLIQVELNRIMLANMCKEFYYLPRVSDNGMMSGGNFAYLGSETATNYVVGPFANAYRGDVVSGFSNYMNYTFFDDVSVDGVVGYDGQTWYSTRLSDLKTGDLYEGSGHKQGDYKVWRYATENVIPAQPANQQKGITTTVIFKGRMIATEEALSDDQDSYTKDMYTYLNNVGGVLKGDAISDPTMYSYNNTLYFTWDNVFHAAIAASVRFDDNGNVKLTEDGRIEYIDRSEPLYVAVFGNGGIGKFTWGTGADGKPLEYNDDVLPVDDNSANVAAQAYTSNRTEANMLRMRNAVRTAGFKIYQSSTDPDGTKGYYCYYFYYNRHNDNGNNGSMGPMEFCVVRNNVYKLSVSDITALGHPRLPENDPDAPTPDDPDESDNVYLTVTCQVIPWVVRLNDIQFH